jgi:hypothetical protein
MKRGISTNRNLTAIAPDLKDLGLDFVFRYYSFTTHQPQKRLTLVEAEALWTAGIEVGVVYEDNPVAASYFSNDRGHADGGRANQFGMELEQPDGSAIYFAMDADFTHAEIAGPILAYMQGVNDGMNAVGSTYGIGVYGSGAACAFLKANCPFVQFTWLAESTGWTGSATYKGWDVKQFVAKTNFGTLTKDDYEDCQAPGEFGGFLVA